MDYHALLKTSGIRVTSHKLAILALLEQHKHLDAVQIAALAKDQQLDISLATVYRTLAVFESCNLITKNYFGNEQASYELANIAEHHDHLVCLSCGKVIEFVDETIEQLQLEIAQQNNFRVLSHTLNIYGNCQQCTFTG